MDTKAPIAEVGVANCRVLDSECSNAAKRS